MLGKIPMSLIPHYSPGNSVPLIVHFRDTQRWRRNKFADQGGHRNIYWRLNVPLLIRHLVGQDQFYVPAFTVSRLHVVSPRAFISFSRPVGLKLKRIKTSSGVSS